MAKFNVTHKSLMLNYADIIRMQIIMHCFSNKISLSSMEIDCLVVLCAYGHMQISNFCKLSVEKGVFKTPQTVRNFLTKAENLKLIKKVGTTKKEIMLNEGLNIQKNGNIMLEYKMYYVAQKE